jgi:hypothetical protein
MHATIAAGRAAVAGESRDFTPESGQLVAQLSQQSIIRSVPCCSAPIITTCESAWVCRLLSKQLQEAMETGRVGQWCRRVASRAGLAATLGLSQQSFKRCLRGK